MREDSTAEKRGGVVFNPTIRWWFGCRLTLLYARELSQSSKVVGRKSEEINDGEQSESAKSHVLLVALSYQSWKARVL
jgi:hypothetical protein